MVQNVSLAGHLALSTYLRNLVESLSRTEGVNVTALVSGGYPDGRVTNDCEILESGTDLYSILGNLFFVAWSLITLWRVGRRNHIDLIHGLYPSSSTIACILYKWMFSQRTKIVYDIRSPWIDMSTQRGRVNAKQGGIFRLAATWLERTILGFVDGSVFITEGLKKQYLEWGLKPPFHCVVSPSGVDTDFFQPRGRGMLRTRLGLSEQVSVIGYVGGIARTRKLSFLFDGLAELNNRKHEKWFLVFVGAGNDLAALKHKATRRGINNVRFLGEVSHSEVPKFISDLDMGVCHLPATPLFNTSFPMKVLEYLACGIPALLSDMPAHRELAREIPGTAIYDFTPESFVEAALKLRRNVKVKPEDVSRFSWARIARMLSKFYKSVLQDDRTRASRGPD